MPLVGCFLGSTVTSFFGERLGRKKSIAIGVAVMIVGAILQSSSYSRAQMIVARIVAGSGMGFINSTVPVFQSEFSPKSARGLYVCMQLSTLNLGIFLAYWIDYGFNSVTGSAAWRVPIILQVIFLLPMFLLISIVPETPRWLAAHGRAEESLSVLQRLHRHRMSEEAIQGLHDNIMHTVTAEAEIGAGSWKDLLRNDNIQSQRRFLIACGIQAFQQLGGINAVCVLFILSYRTIDMTTNTFRRLSTTLAHFSTRVWGLMTISPR